MHSIQSRTFEEDSQLKQALLPLSLVNTLKVSPDCGTQALGSLGSIKPKPDLTRHSPPRWKIDDLPREKGPTLIGLVIAE
ncbi:hypothetical protein MHYP_G00339870 [Metynnis hypsauchen]